MVEERWALQSYHPMAEAIEQGAASSSPTALEVRWTTLKSAWTAPTGKWTIPSHQSQDCRDGPTSQWPAAGYHPLNPHIS